MSEQIDWSKAPEGYPLWLEDLNKEVIDQSGWHCDDGDRYSDVSGRFWLKSSSASYCVHERQTTPPWSGEGLPPVGVVCEAAIPHTSGPNNERSFIWIEGSVIAYYEIKGKTYAWFSEDHGFYPPAVLQFRPIRTPEQIAADKRKIEALKMFNIYCEKTNSSGANMDGFLELYDLGFRKP